MTEEDSYYKQKTEREDSCSKFSTRVPQYVWEMIVSKAIETMHHIFSLFTGDGSATFKGHG